MFESIPMAADDPILGLSNIFNSDSKKNKINLGIGVYIDKHGNTPILPSVKKCEEWLLKNEKTKNYLNIEGIHVFNTVTQSLLFGEIYDKVIPKEQIVTVQTPGGTGALRIAAEFLKKNTNSQRIWISSPSWINHKNIFITAGLKVCTYPYYNKNTHSLDFDKLLLHLKHVEKNDIVLFHCCCHNPTGIDPNTEQWNILAELSKKNKWLPLFDLAYQGFSNGLEQDLEGLHIFCKKNIELIICNSYSKNFGLYNERVGACTVVVENKKIAKHVFSQLCYIIRANYSNPPSHGASIVSIILTNEKFKSMWKNELQNIREYINNMRKLFVYTLQKNDINQDFSFISKQRGMFSFFSLNKNQVITLREKSGIYLVGEGRVNISGLSKENISYVSEEIIKLYKKKKTI